MKHLYENTPFNLFQEKWLTELDKDFIIWLDHVAFYISQKTLPTDRFCGFTAPTINDFRIFANIYHMVAQGRFENQVNVATAVAAYTGTKRREPANAWLGFLHFLLTEHKEKPQLKNIVEAIYCMSAAACNRG